MAFLIFNNIISRDTKGYFFYEITDQMLSCNIGILALECLQFLRNISKEEKKLSKPRCYGISLFSYEALFND